MYYAIEYAYGRTTANGWPRYPDDDGGNRADKVYRFRSREVRDQWVDEGNPNISTGGSRDALTATSSTVRRVLAAARAGEYDWPEA